jgi:dihydroorotate dehydrogenase (fumarate)
MVDLSTSYLGMKLKNPIVASASPLSQKMDSVQQLESAGVSAIVMNSLFEEQIIRDSLRMDEDLSRGTGIFAESIDYLPEFGQYSIGPEKYLDHLTAVKHEVNLPVIGSLNGITPGGWVDYARKIEEAGADALELNIYNVATELDLTSSDLENTYLDLVREIRDKVNFPLAIKLSPFFTALPNFVKQLAESGANGLVLFNRFYQPDLDIEELEVIPNLVLSDSNELRLPLRWIAILYNRIPIDLALTSGVHDATDVLKAIMAGSSITAIASEFLLKGIERAAQIIKDLQDWMELHEYESIDQMKGSMSQTAVAEPDRFVRANYLKVLSSY